MPQSRISPKTLLLLWGNMGKMGHRGGTGPRAFKWEDHRRMLFGNAKMVNGLCQ